MCRVNHTEVLYISVVVKIEALIGAVLASIFFGVWVWSDASIFFGWVVADAPNGHGGMSALVLSPWFFLRSCVALLSSVVLVLVVGVAYFRKADRLGAGTRLAVSICLGYLSFFAVLSIAWHLVVAVVIGAVVGYLVNRAFVMVEVKPEASLA